MLHTDSDRCATVSADDEQASMLDNPSPPDDDDDEPEVTSSTRLIDRHSPGVTVRRRRLTGAGESPAGVETRSRRSTAASVEPSSTVQTDELSCCCCCCCCTCDVGGAPPLCHRPCPATRRLYFRSGAFPCSDDDEADDNESNCSCCQCDMDTLASPHTANSLPPSKLLSVAAMSSGQAVNGRLAAKDDRSPTTVTTGSGGLASLFAFLRPRGKALSSTRSASTTSDVDWRRRRGHGRSTLPPCTCGTGANFGRPLSVAQQVYGLHTLYPYTAFSIYHCINAFSASCSKLLAFEGSSAILV